MLTHSHNPKKPQIRSFFSEKWLLFGVLAGQIDKIPPTSKLASDFCLFYPGIIISYIINNNPLDFMMKNSRLGDIWQTKIKMEN